jgi:hypothetical protein
MLADEIERAKRRALDEGEAAIAQSVAGLCTAPELTPADVELLRPWLAWCKEKSVRHAPAKPWCIAAFILDQRNLDTLAAIEALHSRFNLPNPVMSEIVGAAIERVGEVRAPRSWPKADKALFATLPPQIRHRVETVSKSATRGCAGSKMNLPNYANN